MENKERILVVEDEKSIPLSAARRRMTLRRQQPIAATVFALITESTVYFLTESIFI